MSPSPRLYHMYSSIKKDNVGDGDDSGNDDEDVFLRFFELLNSFIFILSCRRKWRIYMCFSQPITQRIFTKEIFSFLHSAFFPRAIFSGSCHFSSAVAPFFWQSMLMLASITRRLTVRYIILLYELVKSINGTHFLVTQSVLAYLLLLRNTKLSKATLVYTSLSLSWKEISCYNFLLS